MKYVETGKEGTENETRRREDLPSAQSAVNRVHVVDSFLSQALLLFSLRRDRSTVRHPRGCLTVPPKVPTLALRTRTRFPRQILPTATSGCLSSFELFFLRIYRRRSVSLANSCSLLVPMIYHSLLHFYRPNWSPFLLPS